MDAVAKPPPLSTRISTARLVLRAPRASDVPELRRLMRANALHLRPWSDACTDTPSLTSLSTSVLADRRAWRHDAAFPFLVIARDGTAAGPIVGRVTLFGVLRGAQQSGQLGYWIDEAAQGKGLMTEAARAVVDFAFGPAGLHRVQALIVPRNTASRRVVEKLAFRIEGTAERMIRNAGVWEDHTVFAVTAEEWRPCI